MKHGDDAERKGSTSPIKIVEKFGADGRIHRNFITTDNNGQTQPQKFDANLTKLKTASNIRIKSSNSSTLRTMGNTTQYGQNHQANLKTQLNFHK